MTDSTPDWGPWIEEDYEMLKALNGDYVHYQFNHSEVRGPTGEQIVNDTMRSCVKYARSESARRKISISFRYRIRRPRALQSLIDIAENLPAIAPSELEGVS